MVCGVTWLFMRLTLLCTDVYGIDLTRLVLDKYGGIDLGSLEFGSDHSYLVDSVDCCLSAI